MGSPTMAIKPANLVFFGFSVYDSDRILVRLANENTVYMTRSRIPEYSHNDLDMPWEDFIAWYQSVTNGDDSFKSYFKLKYPRIIDR